LNREAVRAATIMIEAATRITRGRGAAATGGDADVPGRGSDDPRERCFRRLRADPAARGPLGCVGDADPDRPHALVGRVDRIAP
jgi:hypothetical protein